MQKASMSQERIEHPARTEGMRALDQLFDANRRFLEQYRSDLRIESVGHIQAVGNDIVRVQGLNRVQSEELLRFPGNRLGIALNLDRDAVGVILLDECEGLRVGDEVHRTGRVMDTYVGEALLGRVVDACGRPLDDLGPLHAHQRYPIERRAPAIVDRAPVTVPLQTGLTVIDALVPIGRGQRQLLLGDRQTGKTAIAVDTILNQRESEVLCIYCAIGQRSADVAKVIADLRAFDALAYTTVVVAPAGSPPGQKFVAPYVATSMAEFFMEQGRDVLVIYDDLTSHARAYRELSLLLERPPGREAYPGDIFYIHSRLLERATHLRADLGGGSITALPIIETQAQNIAAYIPTNLISIADGQIYLSPDLSTKGISPAVDIGRSVSRVGGKTQLPAYRAAAGDLRLSYVQYEELKSFARFGTRLEEETQRILEQGHRVRSVLQQAPYHPLSAPGQIVQLLAVTDGCFDELSPEQIVKVARQISRLVVREQPDICRQIDEGLELRAQDRAILRKQTNVAIDAILRREVGIGDN